MISNLPIYIETGNVLITEQFPKQAKQLTPKLSNLEKNLRSRQFKLGR
jgi:chaperonin cofactor prefoldin